MAMQATHVLCALELEKYLGIEDQAQYLSGVIYPDSRYMCKIDRDLTHNPNLVIKDALFGSDFEKGCTAHVLYDVLQRKYIYDIFNIPHKHTMIGYSDLWFKVSAAKYIEDIHSFKLLQNRGFSFTSIIPTQCPNNEDKTLISEWYGLQHSVYDNGVPCFETYMPILDWFENHRPCAKAKICSIVNELLEDQKILGDIYSMYGNVMKEIYEGLGVAKQQ
jgi:hypothetical protein